MISRLLIAASAALALGTAGVAQEATQGAATEAPKTEAPDKDGPKRSLAAIEPAEGISNETLSEEKLRAFVQALAAVRIVGQHFVPKIEAETDGAKRAELIDYANDSIVNAIEVIADITPEEYKAIDIAAQQDEALNQRILAEIEEASAEGKAAEAEAKKAAEAAQGEKAAEGAETEQKSE